MEPARRRGRRAFLIADGIVDREGVSGLAARLGFASASSSRILVAEVGAGPMARPRTARPGRAHADRVDRTALRGGRARVRLRQHPPVQRHDPGDLRAHPERAAPARPAPARGDAPGAVELRLPARPPLDGAALLDFLAARAVPGIEQVEGGAYSRSLLEHGGGLVALTPEASAVRCVSSSTTCAT